MRGCKVCAARCVLLGVAQRSSATDLRPAGARIASWLHALAVDCPGAELGQDWCKRCVAMPCAEERVLWYSAQYRDWDLSNGTSPREVCPWLYREPRSNSVRPALGLCTGGQSLHKRWQRFFLLAPTAAAASAAPEAGESGVVSCKFGDLHSQGAPPPACALSRRGCACSLLWLRALIWLDECSPQLLMWSWCVRTQDDILLFGGGGGQEKRPQYVLNAWSLATDLMKDFKGTVRAARATGRRAALRPVALTSGPPARPLSCRI